MGIRPDVVVGCSIGALVGAAYACGKLDGLEAWARALNRRSVLGMIDVRLTGGGIIGGAEILAMMESIGLTCEIEDLPIPFLAVAADLQSGREIWLRSGNVAQAVRASVAIPGVISPYPFEGRWLVDGGVVNPVPVSAARALGAEVVIAVNPNALMSGNFWTPGTPVPGLPGWSDFLPTLPESLRAFWPGTTTEKAEEPPAYIELVSTVIDIMIDQIRRSRLAGDPPHVLLGADLAHFSLFDFHRAPEAISEGRRIALEQEKWITTYCRGGIGPLPQG
jgi:NTE family protein